MLKKILLAVAAILVAFLAYVAVQPAHYEISRTMHIQASAEKVFPYLNSARKSDEWSPWKQEDPGSTMVHSGPEEGVGSKSSWEGEKLGTGSATIVESIPNQRVNLKLEYVKPFAGTQDAAYILEPSEGGVNVTWKVNGENNFFSRIMCTIMNMDKMVGGMFEKGLSNLKTLTEKQ